MYRDPFLCHLFMWALKRLPIEWLVRDLELTQPVRSPLKA